MGEFARSGAIARAVLERWPQARVHFLLSGQAPYAAKTAFPATLLPSSPTFHTAAVIEFLRSWRPSVVIFDNAGRSAQIRAARELGARVVYISSRRRQRRKAFRLSWMRALDEHWIAYPKFIAGDLGPLERLKQKLLGGPAVRYLDVILGRDAGAGGAPDARAASDARSAADAPTAVDARTAADDVLVIPGGGTGHPGAGNALGQFLEAARALAAAGLATTFIGPATSEPGRANLRILGSLPQPALAARMRRARLVIVNGGSTLLQAIACGAACIAAPIAGDQLERIRRCARAGVVLRAAASSADIEAKARAMLKNEAARAALARRAAGLALADGLEVALAALGGLIHSS